MFCRLANSARAPPHHLSNGAILTLTSIGLRDWREAITESRNAQGICGADLAGVELAIGESAQGTNSPLLAFMQMVFHKGERVIL
jgi:hypothetical protein